MAQIDEKYLGRKSRNTSPLMFTAKQVGRELSRLQIYQGSSRVFSSYHKLKSTSVRVFTVVQVAIKS